MPSTPSTPSSDSDSSSSTLPSTPRRDLHFLASPIKAAQTFPGALPLDTIITADLESLISREGLNIPYMAEWYGEKDGREIGQVLDLSQSQFNMEPHLMLREFWLSLMNQGRGCTVYFHNWSGYDGYLSLEALISLCDHGFTFTPIINHGKIILFNSASRQKPLY